MMTTAKIDMKTKSGIMFPKGTEFDVKMMPDTYKMAIATPADNSSKPIRVVARLLNKYFNGFVPVNVDQETAEEYMERGLVKSVAGEDVEVDGIDPNGFPSILLIAGYV